jgi:hypothetical protein
MEVARDINPAALEATNSTTGHTRGEGCAVLSMQSVLHDVCKAQCADQQQPLL